MGSSTAQVQENLVKGLQKYGQSIWLDYLRRNLLTTGELKRLVAEDGIRGMTSNPSIFEKAIAGSTDYDEALKGLQKEKDLDAKAIYEHLAVGDIQGATDVMKTVYDETRGIDGFVSLEVSPYLAHDTEGTLEEARRLWKWVDRKNLMIKVPATKEGIPAIRTLISEGINVNVTLLFAQATYEQVLDAYITGLEERVKKGQDISAINSVASFFISRIDTAIDNLIEKKVKEIPQNAEALQKLLGKVAIANGKLTYQRFQEIHKSDRWKKLAEKGAHPQRVLWASTGTKNPNYPDTLYVDELIGRQTVNTVPVATFEAFKSHGKLAETLTQDIQQAKVVMDSLAKFGISMERVTDQLLDEGVKLFSDAFDKLLANVEKKRQAGLGTMLNEISWKLGADLESKVKATLEDWRKNGKVRKLWSQDSSLWTNSDEKNWLGWLGITEDQLAHIQHLKSLADDVKKTGFKHAVLLGMGGSSLGPEVLSKTFGSAAGFPQFHVLDSTDPAQVKRVEESVDLKSTLFIVSSKSGSTLEPNVFKQYFFEKVRSAVGAEKVGEHFIAITDPGSKMQQVAEKDKFRHIFYGLPSIGGRYSVLSNFGMVPAAVMGIDVSKFLDRSELMVHSCDSSIPPETNPGVILGAIMGTLANAGRDKVTIIASPAIYDLGAWLEQLLAESTGKEGKGLIPVDQEVLAAPDKYGADRLFAYVRLQNKPDAAQDKAVDALESAGHPVVRVLVKDIYEIGQEFFRWEIATAVAGSIIKINAFNQPDVEASKIETRKLTDEFEQKGSLPAEEPILTDGQFKLFADGKNAAELAAKAGSDKTIASYLKAHFSRIQKHDYAAFLGYVEMKEDHAQSLQAIRTAVRDAKKVATCLGFGPRFLHSTGQAYKGGPNSGVFLQITCDDAKDLPIPQQKYTFGIVKAAQARGDFQVLSERSRRALRVHITGDVNEGLKKLVGIAEGALK
jgi:transaldolase/glucose-6-phosphate isomerase